MRDKTSTPGGVVAHITCVQNGYTVPLSFLFIAFYLGIDRHFVTERNIMIKIHVFRSREAVGRALLVLHCNAYTVLAAMPTICSCRPML